MPQETPPFVVWLFGEDWDALGGKPDVLTRWLGPDSAESAPAPTAAAAAPAVCKELLDKGHIKHALDTELVRHLVEDLNLPEDHSLMWRRTKLILLSALFAGLAQFPSLLPEGVEFTQELEHLDWILVLLSLTAVVLAWFLGSTHNGRPKHLLLETQSGLRVSTEFKPNQGMVYLIAIQGKEQTKSVPVEVLFTPAGVLCPQPLWLALQDLL
ncbi:hypothetical protein BASA81_001036 [Batrachochytrium salamandrivorans]|nr:hypothetical protein BASA81_001036 [Batrachochytrium salamandrivorans]